MGYNGYKSTQYNPARTNAWTAFLTDLVPKNKLD